MEKREHITPEELERRIYARRAELRKINDERIWCDALWEDLKCQYDFDLMGD